MVGILESEDLEAAAGHVTISSSNLTPGIVMKKTLTWSNMYLSMLDCSREGMKGQRGTAKVF